MKTQRDRQQLLPVNNSSSKKQLSAALSSSSSTSSLLTSAFNIYDTSKLKGSSIGTTGVRNTTEQLRANHIDTLEVLEKSLRENDRLKVELARLRKQCSNNNNDDICGGENEAGVDNDDGENYFLKSLEQEKLIYLFKSKVANYEMEIASLKNPAKSYNASATANAGISSSTQHIMIVEEKDCLIRELYEALAEERAKHDDLLESHDITANRLNSDISGLKFDAIKDKQTIQELTRAIGDLKKEIDELNSILSTIQEKIAMQRDLISQLNSKNELLESKIASQKSGADKYEYDLQSKINTLTQVIETEHDKYSSLLSKCEALMKKNEDLEASSSSGTLFKLTGTSSSSSCIQLDTPLVTLQGDGSGKMLVAPSKATSASSGVSFEEYNATVTRLKRENKELRAQLSDVLLGKKR